MTTPPLAESLRILGDLVTDQVRIIHGMLGRIIALREEIDGLRAANEALQAELAPLRAPIYEGAMGMQTFESEGEARLTWTILQMSLTGADKSQWREFPPDVQARQEARQRAWKEKDEHRQAAVIARGITTSFQGEIP